MALVECPECGKNISSAAATCPHCGYPIETKVHTSSASQASTPSIPEEIRIDSVRCYDGNGPGSTVFGSKVGSVICNPREGWLAFLSTGKSGYLNKLMLGNIGGLLKMDSDSGKLDLKAVEKEGGFIARFSEINAIQARKKGLLGMSRYLYVQYLNQDGSVREKSMITTSGLGGSEFEKVQAAFECSRTEGTTTS